MSRILWGLWLPLLALVAWQIAVGAGFLNPLFFPAPSTLAGSAVKMIRSGELEWNAAATLGRTVVGFLTGSAAGLAVGLLMGGIASIRKSLQPIVSALNATPKVSLLPILILFFGVGEAAPITLIALSSLVIVSIHTFDAVQQIRPVWVELAVNYGATKRTLFHKIYLPACLPPVFTGLRLALANALVVAVACELVTPSSGLGSMIWLAWQTFSTDRLWIALLTTALLGSLLHEFLRRLEKRLVPWKVARFGE
jgi:ABC-type nitrate/sulfonate/bicarbonate transport system permease component